MALAGSGLPTFGRGSNRAPMSVSGTTAAGYFESGAPLLAASGTKRFRVKTTRLVQPRGAAVNGVLGSAPGLATGPAVSAYRNEIASRVSIFNRSGQDAQITLIVAKTEDGTQAETPDEPLLLPAGQSIEIGARVIEVIEKNVGSDVQSGPGVCYTFILETRLSA